MKFYKRTKKTSIVNILNIGVWLLIMGSLSNCKDKAVESKPSDIQKGKGLFVVNEGTFTIGNASLYFINLENESLNTDEDLFKPSNNRPLGDIFQSMTLINEEAWLVVNNSGKIEVVDPVTSKSRVVIKGLKSPRYAKEVMPGKVYVTDLYANAITIINAKTYTKTGEIKCRGWTEELMLYKNKVWVTNHNSHFLYVIDPLNDRLTDSIELAYGGSGILSGKDGTVWVLCSGDFTKNKTGGLFCIDPNTMKIKKQWLFDKTSFNPVKIKENLTGDSLYFVYKGIYGFPKNAAVLPLNPFINQEAGSNFYSLTIQPVSGNIFVADALDFVSRGKILMYSPKGNIIKSYKTGVAPGEFMFW